MDAPGAQSSSSVTHPPRAKCLTPRALIIGTALLVAGNLWVRQAELLTVTCQVSMSVPPVPALTGVVLLLALAGIARRRWPALALSRGEILFIYVYLAMGVALSAGGALRQMAPNFVALQYFATPENGWDEFRRFLPAWVAPTDDEVIRQFFEATEGGVPWALWLRPMLTWLLFVLLLFGALHFMAELFVDQWANRERLAFAINEIPLMITGSGAGGDAPPLWRDPVMWIGFTLALIHNGLNILHAFNPGVPALGVSYDVGALFHERPLNALQPLLAWWRPEVVGFGYLMPLEIVNSALFAYGLLLFEQVGAAAMGYDIPRFPHLEPQSAGCFIAMACIMVFAARAHLADVWRERPWLIGGFLLTAFGSAAWWWAAGMSPVTALGFFGLIYIFALSYSRLRCEAGAPLQWAFPVTEQYRLLIALFGSKAFVVDGTLRNLTIMSLAWFLPRGYLSGLGAYQFESLELSRRAGLGKFDIRAALTLAVVLGTVISLVVQLHTYYQYGANFLEGGSHSGGMRVSSASYAFKMLEGYAKKHEAPNVGESIAALWGLIATFGLTFLRHRFLRFPIHPLGFVLGTVRGYRTWAALLVAATVKGLALRLGGVGLYRRLIPAALGVVLGQFVVAGGIWSLIGAFGGEAFRSYQVWFG